MIQSQPTSTLFPYTTLFRSNREEKGRDWILVLECWERLQQTIRSYAGDERCQRRILRMVCCSRSQHSDRKSTRLNSSHGSISYAVFCLKKKNTKNHKYQVIY